MTFRPFRQEKDELADRTWGLASNLAEELGETKLGGANHVTHLSLMKDEAAPDRGDEKPLLVFGYILK